MHFVRPAIAAEASGHHHARSFPGRAARVDPRRFGRGVQRVPSTGTPANRLSDDLKLFATTFVVGFLFVSVLLA